MIAVIEGLLELLEQLKLPQLVDQQDLKALGDSLCDVIRGKVSSKVSNKRIRILSWKYH